MKSIKTEKELIKVLEANEREKLCLCDKDELCIACKMRMLDEIRPINPPAPGWDRIKDEVAFHFPLKKERERVLSRICNHYLDHNIASKSKTWLYLGRSPQGQSVTPALRPSIWLHDNEVTCQVHDYDKFLQKHRMPYTI